MYHDVDDIWEDGEEAVITFTFLSESPSFYMAVTGSGKAYKLPKEEERRDAKGYRGSR